VIWPRLAGNDKSTRKARGIVSLTGGLGNQLFQYAAAISFFGEDFEITSSLGKPRISVKKSPELFDFSLPCGISIKEKSPRINYLAEKSAGYVLRSSIYPNALEKLKIVNFATNTLANVLISLHLRKPVRVKTERSEYANGNKNYLFTKHLAIGYFQNYKYVQDSNVRDLLFKLKPSEQSQELINLIDKAKKKNLLIVHVRRGDYKLEQFGILEREYYENAINQAARENRFDEIWAYSDEPSSIMEVIPEAYKGITVLVDDSKLSSVEILESMRYGTNYVIANSTFSWWAAYLSYNRLAKVYAPEPWFINRNSHNNMYVQSWTRIYRNNKSAK
jgi:hypothetical protein